MFSRTSLLFEAIFGQRCAGNGPRNLCNQRCGCVSGVFKQCKNHGLLGQSCPETPLAKTYTAIDDHLGA